MLKHLKIDPTPGPFQSHKAMLIMHGRGDVKESFIPFTKELNIAGLEYHLLDAPTTYFFGHSWYPAAPEDPIPQLKHSLTLVDEYIASLGLKDEDIFLAGFSQGAALSIDHAITSGRKFAGIVALSPRIFLRQELLTNISSCRNECFVAHGTFDEMIPFEETSENIAKLQEKGLKVDFHAYEMGHEIDVMEILDLREWVNERL